jgi:hypothetical protein
MVAKVQTQPEQFLLAAKDAMEGVRLGEIGIEQAINTLDGFDIDETDVLEFICDCISEFKGNPRTFAKVLSLLNSNSNMNEIKMYMNG